MSATATLPAFWDRVDSTDEGGCWLWLGKLNPDGYGQATGVNYRGSSGWSAHRLAYTLVKGAIPEGLTLDHVCRVRNCVNPDHLEPVTRGENTARAWAVNGRRRPGQMPGVPTPVRNFRTPPEIWERAKAKAARNGETVTDALNRFLADYTKGEK